MTPTKTIVNAVSMTGQQFKSKIKENTGNEPANPVLLFDGVCNLCNASVQWVLLRDKKAVFRFASLQSESGQQLLARFGLDPVNFNSIVLVENTQYLTRSDAALAIARGLGFPWSLASALRIIPRPLRDVVYDWVSRNRYRWFGKRESCMLPRPEWKARFLS